MTPNRGAEDRAQATRNMQAGLSTLRALGLGCSAASKRYYMHRPFGWNRIVSGIAQAKLRRALGTSHDCNLPQSKTISKF